MAAADLGHLSKGIQKSLAFAAVNGCSVTVIVSDPNGRVLGEHSHHTSSQQSLQDMAAFATYINMPRQFLEAEMRKFVRHVFGNQGKTKFEANKVALESFPTVSEGGASLWHVPQISWTFGEVGADNDQLGRVVAWTLLQVANGAIVTQRRLDRTAPLEPHIFMAACDDFLTPLEIVLRYGTPLQKQANSAVAIPHPCSKPAPPRKVSATSSAGGGGGGMSGGKGGGGDGSGSAGIGGGGAHGQGSGSGSGGSSGSGSGSGSASQGASGAEGGGAGRAHSQERGKSYSSGGWSKMRACDDVTCSKCKVPQPFGMGFCIHCPSPPVRLPPIVVDLGGAMKKGKL